MTRGKILSDPALSFTLSVKVHRMMAINHVSKDDVSEKTIVFLNENLEPESHTSELISVAEKFFKQVISFNLSNLYKTSLFGIAKAVENAICKYNPEIVLIGAGESFFFHPAELYDLKERLPKTKFIFIFSDPEHAFETSDKFYAQVADAVWIYSSAMKPRFEMYRINVVVGQIFDFALYDSLFCDDQSKKKFDVSFIGGVSRSNRQEYLQLLEGSPYTHIIAGYGSPMGRVSLKEKNQLIRESRIHLNFSGVVSHAGGIDNRCTQFKGRVIESILLGAFPVCEFDPAIYHIFGDKLVYFSGPSDFISAIQSAVELLDESQGLQKELRSIVHTEFDPLTIFNQLVDANSMFNHQTRYVSRSFSKRYFDRRMYYFGFFLVKLRFSRLVGEMCLALNSFSPSLKNFRALLRGMRDALHKS